MCRLDLLLKVSQGRNKAFSWPHLHPEAQVGKEWLPDSLGALAEFIPPCIVQLRSPQP